MNAPQTPNKPGNGEVGVKLVAAKELKLPTAVYALAAHPDGKQLFAACFDGGIYDVALETGAIKLLGKHESYASGVQYLPKTNRLISAGYDGVVRWLDPVQNQPRSRCGSA